MPAAERKTSLLRHEPLTSTVRFYAVESDDPFEDFVAVCTLVWESSSVVWIRAMNGEVTRKHLRQLAFFLIDRGVAVIKAHRAPGRLLPFYKTVGDHMEIDLRSFEARYPVAKA